MPPKNTKKAKKNNGTEQGGASQREERVKQERTQLNVEMKSFQRPTIKESLASQGMTLRGCTLRAEQGDMREGMYMELIGSEDENKTREKPILPPKHRENRLSPPPYPTSKPLATGPKNPLPPFFFDSTEMSTDDYNNVSTQLKQAARSWNKNDQHPLDVPSTDSEVFLNVAKVRSDKEIDQTHNTDIEDGSKLTNRGESSEVRGLKSLEIKQKELPQKPSVKQLLSKSQELSSTVVPILILMQAVARMISLLDI